ncbi:hypothetical protein FKW77_001216 [Venturia effusa]|uniref:Uncharacterized protein n=1 Tax=Venturia effusa TaxID=50376 RepID=A0A517LJP5_9PEZI|nr:hypothetical protein FKW77_001216 [Venturia effusa]
MAEPPSKRRKGNDHLDAIVTQIGDLESMNRDLERRLAASLEENTVLKFENRYRKDKTSTKKKEMLALDIEMTRLKEKVALFEARERIYADESREQNVKDTTLSLHTIERRGGSSRLWI